MNLCAGIDLHSNNSMVAINDEPWGYWGHPGVTGVTH